MSERDYDIDSLLKAAQKGFLILILNYNAVKNEMGCIIEVGNVRSCSKGLQKVKKKNTSIYYDRRKKSKMCCFLVHKDYSKIYVVVY